ncbi:MAG: PEPxxWA-CTERM sorting domain-containing protein [Phenylobacterium sp.]
MRASVFAAAAVILGFGLGASGAANAATTLDFSGVCRDCASVGTGTLTLNGAPTGAINTSDFVSFSYKSNLVSFTLNRSDIVAMLGSFDPSRPGATVIDIVQMGGTGWEFERNADGSWSVSSELGASLRGNGGGGGGGGGFTGGGGGGGGSSPGVSGDGLTPIDGAGGFAGGSVGGSTRVVDDFGSTSSFQEDIASAAVVPEPASWALMIAGFAGLGAVLRTRRRLVVTA